MAVISIQVANHAPCAWVLYIGLDRERSSMRIHAKRQRLLSLMMILFTPRLMRRWVSVRSHSFTILIPEQKKYLLHGKTGKVKPNTRTSRETMSAATQRNNED